MVVFLRMQFSEATPVHSFNRNILIECLGPAIVLGYNGEKSRHRSFLSLQSSGSNSILKTTDPAGESHGKKAAPIGHITVSQGTQME